MKVLKPNSQKQNVGLVLALAVLISAATLVKGPIRVASAQEVARSWSYTGDLNKGRTLHTATLLPDADGKVLVAGGINAEDVLDSAELYEPERGTWSFTGKLNVPRHSHTATLLPNGKVLVAGGVNQSSSSVSNTAELYDPDTGTWRLTGNLNVSRAYHTATLLADGKVLVVGGSSASSSNTNTAELYDPATEIWSIAGTLSLPRYLHTATLLADGKVLVAGGCLDPDCDIPLRSAELYDPKIGAWSVTGSLNAAHCEHTATLLPGGKVLVAGGGRGFDYLNSNELYDPATATWGFTASLSRRPNHTATLLANGNVLVAGGGNYGEDVPRSDNTLNNADIYNPAIGNWKETAKLKAQRSWHTATLLLDGRVLVAGGMDARFDPTTFLRSAELYNPGAPIPPPRVIAASVAGKKLIVVGENFDTGAVILINREEQKTANDGQNPQTTLIGKKTGRKIKSGDSVQVRNPDGTLSEEFTFAGT
jgi:hypothetical protein